MTSDKKNTGIQIQRPRTVRHGNVNPQTQSHETEARHRNTTGKVEIGTKKPRHRI